MKQQSFLAWQDLNPPKDIPEHPEASLLQKEVKALQAKLSQLKEYQSRQKQLNDQIDKLQQQSQQHYSSIRKLTLQFQEQYTIFSSKIDNRSDDICDEKDRIESNIYYLEEQNQRLEKMCKQKLQERTKLMQDIEMYHNKKEKLAVELLEEKKKIAQQLKKNRIIQETEESARRENQSYQLEIFQADARGQNLKKYGYEVIPEKIQVLLKTKERIQIEMKELQHKQERHRKSVSKLVKLDLLQKAKEELAHEKQKLILLNELKKKNSFLKQENERLSLLKNSQQQNPNKQLQQLELSLFQQQKKINNIESDLLVLKRKAAQISQRIRQYTNYLRIQAENETIKQQQSDIRKENKEKSGMKQKFKFRQNPTIFQQIKNDLQLRNPSKRFDWKEFLPFRKDSKDSTIIEINEHTYKVKKSSQMGSIIIVMLILLGLSYFCIIKTTKK